jgi:DNA-binding NarL/FixJ family response regulator
MHLVRKCTMRVLIDQLIAADCPELLDTGRRLYPDVHFESFDFLSAALSIGKALERIRPDVVVVDQVWLHLSPLLRQVLKNETHTPPQIVIATRQVNEVFRVQVTHRRFTNVIDLDQSAEDVLVQLCEIHSGVIRNDELWASVPLPSMVADLSETPRDELDRDILSLICVGMHDVDIAKVVHLSTQTVKNRISAMLERSGLRNRTQLAWMQGIQSVRDITTRRPQTHSDRPSDVYVISEKQAASTPRKAV